MGFTLTPLIFNMVHGAGVKVFKKQSAAKATENCPAKAPHGNGFVFSDRPIKVGEEVSLNLKCK